MVGIRRGMGVDPTPGPCWVQPEGEAWSAGDPGPNFWFSGARDHSGGDAQNPPSTPIIPELSGDPGRPGPAQDSSLGG